MNAKDAYQNTLWNKLPYDFKQSIFVATERGEFSVTINLSDNNKYEIPTWISYLRSLDYEVDSNIFEPIQGEKYLTISWIHFGKR